MRLLGEKAKDKDVEEAVDAATGTKSGDAGAVDGRSSLWAMIVIAYGVHKTVFLPFRVGLTAAITPRFVGWLRSKGWAGTAGAMRGLEAARAKMGTRKIKEP